MRWHQDNTGAEWTATVCEDAQIRILRRRIEPPYREGGEPTETFDTFEFNDDQAERLAATLAAAVAMARDTE